MKYDANKLPLGKLNQRTLLQGFETLKRLADLLAHPELAMPVHGTTYAAAVNDLSNLYYSYIPHDFGRNRPPLISNDEMLKREVEILESLSDMSIAEEIMKISADKSRGAAGSRDAVHPLDRQYAGLNMAEMTPLDSASAEFQLLNEYLVQTHGGTHAYLRLRVQDIFRIERGGERDRFAQSPYAALPHAGRTDRRLLWHGSRCTNYGGILSQGLRIAPPEAPVSGYMFGKGIYLADMSSKSANYCAAGLSGHIGLLLLCEAELGRPLLELTNADSDAAARARSHGCFSTWGRGSTTPAGWKDAGCLHEDLRGVLMVRGLRNPPPFPPSFQTSFSPSFPPSLSSSYTSIV
jgi:poly [ADP-ribose] polymerase